MKRIYATSMALLLSTIAPCFLVVSSPATAKDDVPESLRLEQEAEKAYSKKPVVPINRGNAHHRNLGQPSDDDIPVDTTPDSGDSDTAPLPALPPVPNDNTTK